MLNITDSKGSIVILRGLRVSQVLMEQLEKLDPREVSGHQDLRGHRGQQESQ